jgi:flagellar secretion chaperone FliS
VATNPAQSRYLADTVSTATPAQLVVMLYDRLGLDLSRASQSILDADRSATSEHLLHAQQILAELLSSLRVELWDGADNLASIYGFLIRELVEVRRNADGKKLTVCIGVVSGLRAAWQGAANQLSAPATGRAVGNTVPGTWVA